MHYVIRNYIVEQYMKDGFMTILNESKIDYSLSEVVQT